MKKIVFFVAVLLAPASETAADLITVRFEATIYESPFAPGSFPRSELVVGDSLHGTYQFDSATLPFGSGRNFADFQLLNERLSTRSTSWTTQNVELDLSHRVAIVLPDHIQYDDTDVYEVNGFSPISGPAVNNGYLPASMNLFLVDRDAATYRDFNLPVAFPDPSQFEIQLVRLVLVNGAQERADVLAQIDSIRVVPEPSSLVLTAMGAFTVLGLACWSRRPPHCGRRP